MIVDSDKLIDKINSVLSKNYPIKAFFTDINTMSHFSIIYMTLPNYLPFNVDLDGNILNGKYKSKKIMKIFTDKYYSWNKYIKLLISFLNSCERTDKRILYYLHRENKIDILHINNIIIDDKINISIVYNKLEPISIKPIIKIDKENHFYFSSFYIDKNINETITEISRLIKNRDKYNSIHIHLSDMLSGDLAPVHTILRCLVGKVEKWMKNMKELRIIKNKTYDLERDCWNDRDTLSLLRSGIFKTINFDEINKYTGKIHLYMDDNASSAWFLITYLIYAFSSKIEQFSEKHNGQTLKFGTISKDSQLILHGKSSTYSGDGNPIEVKYKDIIIWCPTSQIVSSSIKKQDLNRFWIS
jgi:hypothetical protein